MLKANTEAMTSMNESNYEAALSYLQAADRLTASHGNARARPNTAGHQSLRVLTLNNAACYYRRYFCQIFYRVVTVPTTELYILGTYVAEKCLFPYPATAWASR